VTTNARTTSTSVIMARSEALGPQQRVGQVEQQTQRHESGKRIIEDHGSAPLQPFAGIGVADARREEAEAERQHDDIPHEKLLAARPARSLYVFPGGCIAMDWDRVVRTPPGSSP
jgi:hypothetical protein